jgi:hypothetical protein
MALEWLYKLNMRIESGICNTFTAFFKRIFCLCMNYTHMFGLKFVIESIAYVCEYEYCIQDIFKVSQELVHMS